MCSGFRRGAGAPGAAQSSTAGSGDSVPPAWPSWSAAAHNKRRRTDTQMTLLELSGEYRASAAALRERVLLLEHRLRGADGDGRRLLERRIRLLRAMGREARELAVLCERYYERGYCRNGKYTL